MIQGMAKKRILIVEDDPSVRTLLEKALALDYEIESVADGVAAVRRISQPPAADVILCDIMLPGVDGFEVARRAKASSHWSNVPIVFLTARTTPKDVILGIQAGARHYLTKPFKIQEVLDKLARITRG
ncbi:MAG: Transcriptional regulatory protein TcrA [Deltaproteobacteria bacterium ADurb.Bin207]|jgi:DNA-binding response OmpR family regulator|nr:MAG: Transcriptional regulatory protein TcrA [Deltaproteobacteria bacterium ADurb.Bin207]